MAAVPPRAKAWQSTTISTQIECEHALVSDWHGDELCVLATETTYVDAMQEMPDEDRAELIALEGTMWRAETRWDREYMLRTLAPDFFEFGQSGRAYTHKEILELSGGEIDASLRDFVVRPIRADVVLLTYVSEVRDDDALQITNRSSLWVRDAAGWKLRFHQGTPSGG